MDKRRLKYAWKIYCVINNNSLANWQLLFNDMCLSIRSQQDGLNLRIRVDNINRDFEFLTYRFKIDKSSWTQLYFQNFFYILQILSTNQAFQES